MLSMKVMIVILQKHDDDESFDDDSGDDDVSGDGDDADADEDDDDVFQSSAVAGSLTVPTHTQWRF